MFVRSLSFELWRNRQCCVVGSCSVIEQLKAVVKVVLLNTRLRDASAIIAEFTIK